MKPGTSFFTCAGILPASACSFMVKSIAAGEVHCVPMTSTSGTRNGGFHQCVPSARSRSLQALHDLGDRHHRGVAGEDGVGPDVLLDLAEDLLLQRHVFEHRLDHVIGVAHAFGHIGNGPHALDGVLVVAEIAQVGRDPLLHRIEVGLVRIRDGDVMAGEREHLRDAVAHEARADDGDARFRGHEFSPRCSRRRRRGCGRCRNPTPSRRGTTAARRDRTARRGGPSARG